MSGRIQGSLFMLGLTTVAMIGVACSNAPEITPTPEPSPVQSTSDTSPMPTPETVAVKSADIATKPTPAPTSTSRAYDPQRIMYELFPSYDLDSPRLGETLDEILANQDSSQVPILVEVLRFMPSLSSREQLGSTLRDVTGQTFASDDWSGWMEWLGKNLKDYQPPQGYVDWKARLMGALDPRFVQFLRPANEFSRIDLSEVVWGGVLPDGIPDLRDPAILSPAEADYLNNSDRVFGVTINGESRAYPLRIVNAHEMVNDTLGGEPISLMW